MVKTDTAYAFFIVGIVLGALAAFISSKKTLPAYNETQTAIKECERHLPRNQHCVYRITAEVKKDGS